MSDFLKEWNKTFDRRKPSLPCVSHSCSPQPNEAGQPGQHISPVITDNYPACQGWTDRELQAWQRCLECDWCWKEDGVHICLKQDGTRTDFAFKTCEGNADLPASAPDMLPADHPALSIVFDADRPRQTEKTCSLKCRHRNGSFCKLQKRSIPIFGTASLTDCADFEEIDKEAVAG